MMYQHDSGARFPFQPLTWPSSSFKADVRARGGVSVSSWYMSRSLLMKTIAWKYLKRDSQSRE
jgi:hypothetical protein